MLRKLLLLIGLLLLLITPLAAQNEDSGAGNPLLRLLALVPDTPETRTTWLSYADYRALEAVRGIDTPTAADFNDRTELSGLWIAASMGLSGGFPFQNLFAFLEDMPELVGFSFFDMDRSLVFGQPPAMGNIFEGDFDPAQIAEAFTARDFTEEDFDGVLVWCGAAGCENGLQTDLANRNPGNPFGGDLGRSEPVAVVSDTLLANSANDGILRTMIATYQGEYRSLAEADDYRAIAQALADQGIITQVQFVNPLELLTFDPAILLGPGATAETMEQLREAMQGNDMSSLPPYSAVALADVGTADEQLMIIALAYSDADSAAAAGAEVVARLEDFTSIRTQQPFSEILEANEAVINAPFVYESAETGQAVAVISIAYPLPSNEEQEDALGSRFQASSLLYRFFSSELLSRGLYFLAGDF